MLYKFEPGYCVPSHTFVASLLRKKHVEGQIRLKALLEPIEAVSLTTDLWTSKALNGYLTVTAHFVSSDWKLASCVLATSCFTQHRTATNTGQRLVEISRFFGVAGQGQTVIHDEATNQVAALRVAADENRKQNLGGSSTSIVCVAHRLQTCLKYGFDLPAIATLVSAGRKLVGHFRHSTKATHALITAQKPREQEHGQHRVQQQQQQGQQQQ